MVAILGAKQTNKIVVFTHGILAAAALALLIVFLVNATGGSPMISLILFIIVAIVGFFLFARDLSKKPGPKPVAFIHGVVAVISFIILLIFVLNL